MSLEYVKAFVHNINIWILPQWKPLQKYHKQTVNWEQVTFWGTCSIPCPTFWGSGEEGMLVYEANSQLHFDIWVAFSKLQLKLSFILVNWVAFSSCIFKAIYIWWIHLGIGHSLSWLTKPLPCNPTDAETRRQLGIMMYAFKKSLLE